MSMAFAVAIPVHEGLSDVETAKKRGEPLSRLPLYCLYSPPCPSSVSGKSQARAAAVAVAIIRCGEWWA